MSIDAKIRDGSVIVQITDHPQDDFILLTVSKERWDQDAQQVKLSRPIAYALGEILKGSRQ